MLKKKDELKNFKVSHGVVLWICDSLLVYLIFYILHPVPHWWLLATGIIGFVTSFIIMLLLCAELNDYDGDFWN